MNNIPDFDFGFSAVSEAELKIKETELAAKLADTSNQLKNKVADASDNLGKLNKMYQMIMPLLDNLKQNPEKDYIFWPNRKDKIDAFVKSLKELMK